MYSLTQLDRTIYEHLRLETVTAGQLPDVTQYTDGDAWQAARDGLRATLGDGELIDVFGVGAADERGEWTGSKIVINRTTEGNGSIGAGGYAYGRVTDGVTGVVSFEKTALPTVATNITYEITVTATAVRRERIMSEIVGRAFGKMRYIGVFEADGTISPTKKVFVRQSQKFDQSSMQFIQKVITLTIEDLLLLTDSRTEDDGNISQINSINFQIYAASKSNSIVGQSVQV